MADGRQPMADFSFLMSEKIWDNGHRLSAISHRPDMNSFAELQPEQCGFHLFHRDPIGLDRLR